MERSDGSYVNVRFHCSHKISGANCSSLSDISCSGTCFEKCMQEPQLFL